MGRWRPSNPQVTIDLINCTQLIKKDGILCNDDVIDDLNHKKIIMSQMNPLLL